MRDPNIRSASNVLMLGWMAFGAGLGAAAGGWFQFPVIIGIAVGIVAGLVVGGLTLTYYGGRATR
jgi:hypothetical protein